MYLCSAEPSLADQTSYIHCLSRRNALTQWLMEAASTTVEREVAAAGDTDAEYLEAVFSLVSGRQMAAACRLAHQHRDHKLALLLGQVASSSANSRQLAYEQLDIWRRMGVGVAWSRPHPLSGAINPHTCTFTGTSLHLKGATASLCLAGRADGVGRGGG